MSLEQLLPGGLYKATVEENNEFEKKSKISGMSSAHKVEGIIYEVLRDSTLILGPYIVLSSEHSAQTKAVELGIVAVHYVAMSYFFPMLSRGKNSAVTNYRTRKIVSMLKKKREKK